jgi:hypothetical protein
LLRKIDGSAVYENDETFRALLNNRSHHLIGGQTKLTTDIVLYWNDPALKVDGHDLTTRNLGDGIGAR